MRAVIRRLLRAVSPTSLLVHHLDREVELLTEANDKLERQLASEVADNARLADELTAARRLLVAAARSAGPCVCENLPGAIAFWQRQASQDRRNAVRLEDRLAAAEGRPVIGSLT